MKSLAIFTTLVFAAVSFAQKQPCYNQYGPFFWDSNLPSLDFALTSTPVPTLAKISETTATALTVSP